VLGLVDPGDEILTFEPFYDSYPACAAMAGARLRAVPLRAPDFTFDEAELAAAFSSRTRAFLLNTPHNPTGRVFTEAELATIVELCRHHGAFLLTDEVYEHLTFDGHRHVSPAQLDRSIVMRVSSAAKTFSLTGWKVGWATSPPGLAEGLRRAHQYLVFCTAAPLQEAIALALEESPSRGYYDRFRADYAERRAVLVDGLRAAGFAPTPPEGAYFAMADYSAIREGTDGDAFVRELIRDKGVVAIPPASFYEHEEHARGLLRFAFCKRRATLEKAMALLNENPPSADFR